MNHADCLEILYFPPSCPINNSHDCQADRCFLSLGLLVMPGSFLLLSGLIK